MKNFTKSILAAGVLALSGLSHAAPVLTWNVDVVGKWTSYAPLVGVTLSGADDTILSWGTPLSTAGQSSLTITNPDTTPVDTYFGGGIPPAEFIAPSVTLTHANNVILSPSLTSAELTVDIFLTPTNPADAGFPLIPIAYNIAFKETPNTVLPCAVGDSPTPCNDIFVLVGGFLNDSFILDGFEYFVNAFPTDGGVLGILDEVVCAAAGQAANCIGFTTPENQSTDLAFGLTISAEPLEIPEPGSLALIGLAMAGLAVATRRRKGV